MIDETMTGTGRKLEINWGRLATRLLSTMTSIKLWRMPNINAAFSALVMWLSDVISVAPAAARRPYLAYEQSLLKFIDDVTQ